MSAAARLPDQDARDAAREATDRSLLVEASAGTGKTTTLVSRMLKLVIEDGVPLRRISALTFTEKAAGEMKARLKEKLDAAIEKLRRTASPALDRALEARRDLPGAEIGTLHAFCARLLRERPVEARLPPDFVFPDQSVARDLVREAFDGWAREEARDPTSPLHAAILAGVEPERLRALAEELYESRAVLDGARLPDDVLGEARAELRALARELAGVLDDALEEERRDPKGRQVREAVEELTALSMAGLEELTRWTPRTETRFRSSARPLWTGAVRERLEKAWTRFKELPERLAMLRTEPLLLDLVGSLRRGLFPSIEERKRRRGFVDFDDLLILARDLLRGSRAAREHFRRRTTALIVDEFQDTDPLQAEIVLRLSAGEPQDAASWQDLAPRPGTLFLVGDPKQSIFRFRRADVETYRGLKQRFLEIDRLALTANFRSAPRLLDFVNAVFAPVFREDGERPWEVGYSPLMPPDEAKAKRDAAAVLLLEPPEAGAPVSKSVLRRQEVRAVVNLLLGRLRPTGRTRARHQSAWQPSTAPPSRPWHDFAVLVPDNEGVEVFRDVLTEAGIPVTLEGGTAFYRREETAAVTAALIAIDDPGDAVVVVAALKSFLFGASDTDLVGAAEAGTKFGDPASFPAASPLRPAIDALLELHARRHSRPLAETLLALLSSRAAFASVEGGAVPHGAQGVANLERLLVTARGLDREGLSFRQAVERLRRRLEDAEPEPRAAEEGVDAVRVTTIHKAKGLEYPVVVAAGLGLTERARRDSNGSLRCDRAGGDWGVTLDIGGVPVATPGYARIGEGDRLRAEAELKRLLYVAFTRAKETLVVSCFRDRKRSAADAVSDPLQRTLLGTIEHAITAGGVPAPLVERVAADVTPRPRKPEQQELAVAPDAAHELETLVRLRERVAATASRALRRAGERDAGPVPAAAEDLPAVDREASPSGRALRVGVAVHEAMERLLAPHHGAALREELLDGVLADVLAELAADEAAEARRLVRHLLTDPVVPRALAARRRFVELPLLYRAGGPGAPLVEGKLDLLFEEADGFTIVDWKTDRAATPEERRAREELYAPQLAAYAEGLRAVLGPDARVKEVRLVFARPGPPPE